jgi:hypothetical protein
VNWFVGVNTTSIPNAPYLWLASGVLAWWLVDRKAPRRIPVTDPFETSVPAAAVAAHG